jgi:uncharacterized protein YegL
MKKGKTEIILIVDRSGSMQGVKNDIEGGFKSFLEKQKEQEGECLVSYYQFDDKYETVFENKDIQQVDGIEIKPRGWTALLDAVGKTINTVGERLSKTPEEERPSLVIVVTLTDGQENASKEFTTEKIQELVKHQTDTYKWKFVFLGADKDTVLTAKKYGFAAGSSMAYNPMNTKAVNSTFMALASGVSCLRDYSEKDIIFTHQDRTNATVGKNG